MRVLGGSVGLSAAAGLVLFALVAASPARAQATFDSGIALQDYAAAPDGVALLNRILLQRRLPEVEAAATTGNAEARYLLGVAHLQGIGLARDTAKARELLRQSAMAGFARAKFGYGQMLLAGEAGRKDEEEGVGWLEQASEAGIASAAYQLGRYYRYTVPEAQRSNSRAHDWFVKAAALGSLDAKAELALEGYYGTGRPADPLAAIAELEGLARQGSAMANWQMGAEYRFGAHVGKDPARALAYFTAGAKVNSYASVQAGASMLMLGEAGQPDPVGAVAFLIANARPDDWQSQALLAKLLIETGTAPPKGVNVEKLALDTLEHGAIDGFGALMVAYREGKYGYRQDLAHAARLARRGLKVMEGLDLSQEGAWPMHAQGAAYTILRAIEAHAIASEPGEVTALQNRYGAPDRMKKLTLSVSCTGGAVAPVEFYVWEVFGERSPLEGQIAWLEKARACKVSAAHKAWLERLFNKSRATGKPFQDLVVTDLANPKRTAPMAPIEF